MNRLTVTVIPLCNRFDSLDNEIFDITFETMGKIGNFRIEFVFLLGVKDPFKQSCYSFTLGFISVLALVCLKELKQHEQCCTCLSHNLGPYVDLLS